MDARLEMPLLAERSLFFDSPQFFSDEQNPSCPSSMPAMSKTFLDTRFAKAMGRDA